MKKFLIIVFLSVIFSFNFNWVYGQNCQNDISVSSTQECVINKINQIINEINRAKNSLEDFEYGARYGNGKSNWSEKHLLDIISLFQSIKSNLDRIKTTVENEINSDESGNYKKSCPIYSHPRGSYYGGGSASSVDICWGVINRLLSSVLSSVSSNLNSGSIFLNFAYEDYGVSIVLEDTKSYIFLSITNERIRKFSTTSVARSVLDFLDKIDSFLTYIESFRDIGYYIQSFGGETGETSCVGALNKIKDKINNTTSLDYIRKVDKHIDFFDQAISKKHFLDTFHLVSEGGIVKAFFDSGSHSGVWQDGEGYYKVGVYLKNIDKAANAIKNKANGFIEAYNLYLKEACTIYFFETGKTPSGINAEELPGKMEELTRNFSPIIKSGYIRVKDIDVPIAVIPPVVWSDEHLGTKTLAAITPERVFNEVRNFVFSLAPFVFTILLLAGALFYLLSPFDIEKIKTGSEYIKWAVFGYFLLLIITSILLALRFIFGGP
jgi:hypothetical protein